MDYNNLTYEQAYRLKYGVGGYLQTAGAVSSAIPTPYTQIIGAGLSIAGGIVGSQEAASEEAAAQQKQVEARQAQENRGLIQQDLQRQQGQGIYAIGGNLNNQITQYNGPSHQQGGIPLGTTGNEVEGGETRGMGDTKDYIFSDRLKPKKGDKTYSDMSKDIEKKYKNSDYDNLQLTSKNRELDKLKSEQEFRKSELFEKQLSKLQKTDPEKFQQLMSQQGQGQNQGKGIQQGERIPQMDGSQQGFGIGQEILQNQSNFELGGGLYTASKTNYKFDFDSTPSSSKFTSQPNLELYGNNTNSSDMTNNPEYIPGITNSGIKRAAPVNSYSNAVDNSITTTNSNDMTKTSTGLTLNTSGNDNLGSFQDEYNLSPSKNKITYNTKNNPHWSNDKDTSYTSGFAKQRVNDLTGDKELANYLTSTDGGMQGYFDYLLSSNKISKADYDMINDGKFGPVHNSYLKADWLNDYKGSGNPPPTQPKIIPNDPATTKQTVYDNYEDDKPDLTYDNKQDTVTRNTTEIPQGNIPKSPFKPNWMEIAASGVPNAMRGIGAGILGLGLDYGQAEEVGVHGYNPDYVDPTRPAQEIKDQYSNVKDQARQVSTGTGNYMSNLIGSTASESKKLASLYSKYANTNAGISNQADNFNATAANQMERTNAQIDQFNVNMDMRETQDKTGLYQQAIQGLAQSGADGFSTYMKQKRDQNYMNVMQNGNQGYAQDDEGNWVKAHNNNGQTLVSDGKGGYIAVSGKFRKTKPDPSKGNSTANK